MSLRRLLKSHLAPHRRAIVLVLILQAGQTTTGLLLPGLNATLIDDGVLLGDQSVIWRMGGIMLLVSFIQVVLLTVAVWYGSEVAMSFGRDIRRDVFDRVTRYSTREIGRFGTPSLITRITNDTHQIQTLTALVTIMMITAPLTMIAGTVLAIREDAGLSVLLLVVVPLEIVVAGAIIVAMNPAFQQMQERIDRINAVLREQITGVRVVRAFTREPTESARFAEANHRLTESSLRAARLMAAVFPAVTLLVNLSSVALLWIGADRIEDGSTQIGSLVAYLTYLLQILLAVTMAAFMVSMIPRAAVAAERIVEVLDTESSVEPPSVPVQEFTRPGTVEFQEVGFRYPGAEHHVLEGISFSAVPGETTAIIGSTGAGKTTLLTLAARLADASSGRVSVGGIDVRRLDQDLLWGAIGYVPQRAYLFSGTVASNLRYGRPEATDEELWEALEVAQAAGFVQTMPEGLKSRIAQGGTNVSGGQRQRLSIARALIAQPAVYLFDDSFSALDLATEARLRQALEPRTRNAAILVVAQRISTIETADQIIVLEGGIVVGQGRHNQLVDTCPTYAEIVSSQRGGETA
ncbi:MAG: ABC transporter ATP-binding protein [Acidimicrobiia bacterium]|nr:ABC transporter ATP-binding protein [Acidimicrobiia bacterium]MYE74587.1 ABC transporter ATP-binding protein [Acidimicrobiia bacterium]MYJ60813.1 ABC transporter ATP-binding protein [Acidimicrobiia bacterium]